MQYSDGTFTNEGREMPRRQQPNPVRGVFERPKGSGVWWVNYYLRGKQHREKVGRRSDAIALYQKRKADARRNLNLPELRPGKEITFGDLASATVNYARAHLRAFRGYEIKEGILKEPFGSRPVMDITPAEIDAWLTKHCMTPATANRYRAFFSLSFRLGMENGKVTANPARLVRRRTENNGRLRFLSRKEYDKLSAVIRRKYSAQHPAFVVGVYTGMRWSEQFTLTWEQVNLKNRVIHLPRTKDPTGNEARSRNVPLNSIALAAMKEQWGRVPHKPTDSVFPGAGDYCRFWFKPSLKAAKIRGITWHNLRHTFCSWLAMAAVSIKEIQELAGHKTITMTARYMHLAPQRIVTASERMVKRPTV